MIKISLISFVSAVVLVSSAAHADRGSRTLPRAVTNVDYYPRARPIIFELGRLLFFDPILSGNKNISCASCHHPSLASADGVALGLGEGAEGLGARRRLGRAKEHAVHGRIPRNSQALFNLGAREYRSLFHDGRVEIDEHGYYESGFITPAKWKLPNGLDTVLAAQAMFPVSSPDEMAGQKGENPIANAAALNRVSGEGGLWHLLAQRIQGVPTYVALFRAAYPERIQSAEQITMVDIANAIAAFEASAFRSDSSPFDAYLRGKHNALGNAARRGMKLFYGRAGCSSCHAGAFQTDHSFHAIAMPQIGPGKGDGADASYWRSTGQVAYVEDFGRGRVSFRPEDNFKFRTPSLRNVAHTGPWGHDGAFDSLEAIVRHHLDPVASLHQYSGPRTPLPLMQSVLELTAKGSVLGSTWIQGARRGRFLQRDAWVQNSDELRDRIASANELQPLSLEDAEVAELIAFLESLSEDFEIPLTSLVPAQLPSGLPVQGGR